MRSYLAFLTLVFSIGLIPFVVRAQWQPDGAPVSTATSDQGSPTVVSDGAGGAIVTWTDYRNFGTTGIDIYAQRVNASGVPQWTADGVALCLAAFRQLNPTIVSDGAGGAIVTWQDERSGNADIYAQRVNTSGVIQWAPDGVALSIAFFDQQFPMIVSDGASGAIATWQDFRTATNSDIYAQRVNSSGVPQWTAHGVALSAAINSQQDPAIVSDGAGGAIVTWHDFRNGNADIYAQRVNSSGVPQWTADGVALSTAFFNQQDPMIVSDGASGAIATWQDFRTATNSDIYAQRVNSSGVPQWTDNGVALSTASDNQQDPMIVSDGAGGAVVTWHDFRSGNYDIYAQRVNASGARQWTANGVALSTAADQQYSPTIASDGAGGAIVTWYDFRGGSSDIYARRVNASGAPLWTADGVGLCTATFEQSTPTIASDGAGGVIVTWQDYRSAANYDVYAQRLEADFGSWGHPEPLVTSADDIPDDQGGKVAVNWKRSGYDVLPLQEISHYSVWRAVDPVAASSVTSSDGWVDPLSIDPDFHGPAFSRERIGTTDYYWEWVANQNSTHDAGYSFAAATREDSVAGNAADHYFRVLAHTSNPYVLYKSNTMSGHSVDNLAPAAPLMLTAQRVGSDVQLEWNRAVAPDLRDYSIYRATLTGVTPVPINYLASSDDTVAVDASAPVSALYYIVTAYDVHANQSDPSNEASVGALTGIGNTPSIAALTVLDNMPNPFAGTTTLRVGLPKATEVEIEVFDVAGRRVRSERTATLAAGWRDIAFDARDAAGRALPSGVYFYRVEAAGETITRKMVVAR